MTGMSAAVLTLVFVLYFPAIGQRPPPLASGANNQASYTPLPPLAQQAPIIATPAPPVPVAHSVASAPRPTSPVPQVSPDTKVQTASLSLSRPGATSDGSGIDSALAGQSYHGTIHVEGFNVPLPAGNWVLLANTRIKLPTANGQELYLGQIKKKHLEGAVRIIVARSLTTPGAGFPKVNGCIDHQENNNYTMSEEVTPSGHEACWIIQNYFASPLQQWADRAKKIPALERAAAGDLAAKGVSYAQDLVAVRFSRAETWGLMEVSYLFSPEGFTSTAVASYTDSDWHAGNIERFPEKVAYVEKLKTWGAQFWPRFKSAFVDGEHTQ
jgi:hypothetical protein